MLNLYYYFFTFEFGSFEQSYILVGWLRENVYIYKTSCSHFIFNYKDRLKMFVNEDDSSK